MWPLALVVGRRRLNRDIDRSAPDGLAQARIAPAAPLRTQHLKKRRRDSTSLLWGIPNHARSSPIVAKTSPLHSAAYRRFLERLRAARLGADLTQVDVATALGKPTSFVSKCELGERRVDFVELVTFARLYRKPLDHFADPPGPARGRRRSSNASAH